MGCTTTMLVVALCLAMANALPAPQEQVLQSQALDRLVMIEADNEAALRSKRTIGLLRQLFPEVSQIVEQKVGLITSELIRVLGPILLRGALGGGGGGGGSRFNNSGTTVTVASPFDSNDDRESVSTSQNGARVSIALPTFPPDDDELDGITTVATAIFSDENSEAENQVGSESQNSEVRVQFADAQTGAAANEAAAPELAPLDDIEVSDDNRNKRFLNFGFGATSNTDANAAGSGGGSGNFLFDIIRQTADGAARAAGTMYRVVAGTQSLGLGLSASRDVGPAPASASAAPAAPAASTPSAPAAGPVAAAPPPGVAPPPAPTNGTAGPGLVAGSGSTEQGDAAANAPAAPGRAASDELPEAVPGPITRLFVIANRGISNLVQDLILRLAATSERIVNFKARLITSII